MATLVALTGPVVAAQFVVPETPVIVHVPSPVGALAALGPDAVAVKVIVDPRVAVGWSALTAIVGAEVPTKVVSPDVGGIPM